MLKMTNYWAYIAAVGSVLTFLTVAPYLFGMVGLTMNMSIETADPAMLERAVRLMVGAIMALVPLSVGGIALFALFESAEAQA